MENNKENTQEWGVNMYILRNVWLKNSLIRISEENRDDIMLDICPEKNFRQSGTLFDVEGFRVYLYYRGEETRKKIAENKGLFSEWYDTDCYDLSESRISELRKRTYEVKKIFQKLTLLNKEFQKAVSESDEDFKPKKTCRDCWDSYHCPMPQEGYDYDPDTCPHNLDRRLADNRTTLAPIGASN